MAIRNVLKEPDETLRKKSKVVTVFDQRLHQLLDDMKDTMYAHDGAGLAAPQVGVLRRVVVVDAGNGFIELINPEIIETEGEVDDWEGCLSSPGEYGMVKRPKRVVVKAQDRFGEEFTMEGIDLQARAFCHETDHLNGVLFKDLATELADTDELVEERRKKKK